MRNLILAFCLSSGAIPALAQDTLFAAPGNTVVQMDMESCPTGMICVEAMNTTNDVDVNLILPEWIDTEVLAARSEDVAASAYLLGVSDSHIIDICNYCGCCSISEDPGRIDSYVPWDPSVQPQQSPRALFELEQ